MTPTIPTLDYKTYLIFEQMTMLNVYFWWSGQGFTNLMNVLTYLGNLIN